ncbi:hypothetical protein DPX16_2153 [Anabarilius grahami]|uniref:Uncharacterized protein n=1 Tax=Anabarilius grahami TaxID=495550 RepID=A0A3N0XPC6_ANAGA|nr:hypothetical protein DPX16_2153 [Anabarilius grahami]
MDRGGPRGKVAKNEEFYHVCSDRAETRKIFQSVPESLMNESSHAVHLPGPMTPTELQVSHLRPFTVSVLAGDDSDPETV